MDENKNTFSFADEQIKNVQEKMAEQENKDRAKEREIFLRINSGVATPEILPTNTPNQETSPLNNTSPQSPPTVVIKSLRTFQGDLADAIQKQNASIVTVAIAEKKKQEREAVESPAPTKQGGNHTVVIVITSIVLILLGVASIGTFFYLQSTTPKVTTPNNQRDTIVPYNEMVALSVDGAQRESLITTLLSKSQETKLKENEILYIELRTEQLDGTEVTIPTRRLFEMLNTKAPPALIRSFTQTFMFGAYVNLPFLLIELDSFDNAFKGMLEWENSLYQDVGQLFSKGTLSITEKNPNSATTTRIVNIDEPRQSFEDITLRNKDARVLKNSRGETVLIYSFLDNKTLLITGNEDILREMIGKLASKKLIR